MEAKFIVLKSTDENEKYLSCTHNQKEMPGFLQFSGEDARSHYCKFEVEKASGDNNVGLVHIRSCSNNKYWISVKGTYWITAQADKKEEDKSNWSCTLFKPTAFPNGDVVLQNVFHGRNAARFTGSKNNSGLYMQEVKNDKPTMKFMDWDTLIILPKHITFKDAEGSYLGARQVDGRHYLKFQGSGDIEDPTIGHQVVYTPDGYIRIKSIYTEKFWRRSPNWIWPDSNGNSDINTVFSVTKIDDDTIALTNLGNHKYCKTYSDEGKTYCLNASADTIWKDVRLKIGEYVKKREISEVKYQLDSIREYNAEIIHCASQTTHNIYSSPVKKEFKFTYKTEKSQTWNSSVSKKFGIETSITAGVPTIGDVGVTISVELESKFEWGETKSESFTNEMTYSVEVPPMTEIEVILQAKKVTRDIPYSYKQCDTLPNGTKVEQYMEDGVYRGVNTFDFGCKIQKKNDIKK